MSNKKILEEATIRRFMKLASIDKLSENFLDTVQEEEQVEETTETTAETVEEEKEIEEGADAEEVTEAAEETVEEGTDAEEVSEAKDEDEDKEKVDESEETVDEEVQLPEEDDMEGGEEPEAMDMDMGADDAAPAAEADVAAALKTIADALGAAGIDIEVKDDGEEMADEPEMDMGDEPAAEDPMQQEEVAEERMDEDDEFLESVANKVLQRIRETLKKNK